MPPPASTCWKEAHAASATSAVNRSTYQLPPAGSATAWRCASSRRIAWVVAASRRAPGSLGPMARSNGSEVTASAPPTAAAKLSTVTLRMLTHGSRTVIVRGDDTAWNGARWAAAEPPQALTTSPTAGGRPAAWPPP